MKKVFKKVGYLRAIFIMFPIGVMLIVFGIKGFNTKLDKLDKRIGVITHIKYSDKTAFIKLNKANFYYETSIDYRVETIRKKLNIGDKVQIYKRKGESKFIQGLYKSGNVLIEYNPPYKAAITTILIGIILLIITVLYIIKSPYHLWGGDKEKMTDFLDPWKKYKEK